MNHAQDPQISELIEQTLPLVKHIVFEVSAPFPRHADQEELAQAGVFGLVQAAHRYDPGQGIPFRNFASKRIRGAILDAARGQDWASRSVRRAGRSLEATTEALAKELGRTPTATEIAATLGLSLPELANLKHQLAQSVVFTLDRPIVAADPDADVTFGATLADPSATHAQHQLEARELGAYLRDAIDLLPEPQRIAIQGIFFERRTLEELARELGLTISRVSQLRAEALEMLRVGISAQYRLPGEAVPIPIQDSARKVRRKKAYTAAVATRRTWRSRLDGPPVPVENQLDLAI